MHRFVTITDVTIATLVVLSATSRAPSLYLDIFAAGLAFAALIHWKGHWSLSFVLRSAVAAYFFRCVVLIIAGTDTLKAAASRDAVIGFLGIGVAYGIRRLAVKFSPSETASSGDGVPGGFALRKGADDRPDWTPLQFNLGRTLMLVFACAALFAVASSSGPSVAVVVILLGLLWYLFAGVARLLTLG